MFFNLPYTICLMPGVTDIYVPRWTKDSDIFYSAQLCDSSTKVFSAKIPSIHIGGWDNAPRSAGMIANAVNASPQTYRKTQKLKVDEGLLESRLPSNKHLHLLLAFHWSPLRNLLWFRFQLVMDLIWICFNLHFWYPYNRFDVQCCNEVNILWSQVPHWWGWQERLTLRNDLKQIIDFLGKCNNHVLLHYNRTFPLCIHIVLEKTMIQRNYATDLKFGVLYAPGSYLRLAAICRLDHVYLSKTPADDNTLILRSMK